ncbi:MAG TPA: hypothetical protein ENO22_05680 [candidate division Zixibacteria bacterium]|nr:hypothetical protein [candidate division Zixibacteria bacterium]
MHELILITGAARSGISLIGDVLQLCGAHNAVSDRDEIRETMVKPILRGLRADCSGQNPLPSISQCLKVSKIVALPWRRNIERTVAGKEGQIYYASPLSCLIWPIWTQAFPRARWIIVRREDQDIVSACIRTGYMNGYKNKYGWQEWVDWHKRRFPEIVSANASTWTIWPHKLMTGDLSELKDLILALGLRWDIADVEDFLAPVLWKGGVFEVKK